MRQLSYSEKLDIASDLLMNYHSVFYKFWDMCSPCFVDKKEVPTACVGMDEHNNNLLFYINEEFWNGLSDTQKAFIVAHEAYHLINQHGSRADGKCDEAKNVTMDIPINEGLVKYFGFDRSKIDQKNEFCWLDTIFKPEENAEGDRSFEYYYNKLKNLGRIVNKPKLCNGHDYLSKINGEKALDALIERLDEHEAKNLQNILEDINSKNEKNLNNIKENGKIVGSGALGTIAKIAKKFVPKKKKWETIIRKYARKFIEKDTTINQWAQKSRRERLLPHEIILPSDIDEENTISDREKRQVFCYLDASGSCWSYKDRFYNAFRSFPKTIKVRLFSFDDVIYELNKKECNMRGGGGTSFRIIENHIQNIIQKEGIKYPHNVFVFTDGYGDQVKPAKPKNWIVFLTSGGSKYCFPPNVKFYDLSQFE